MFVFTQRFALDKADQSHPVGATVFIGQDSGLGTRTVCNLAGYDQSGIGSFQVEQGLDLEINGLIGFIRPGDLEYVFVTGVCGDQHILVPLTGKVL